MTSIGSYAFDGCSSLTSIVIPDGVTSIGELAFCNCSSLTSVTFKNTNNWHYTNSYNSSYIDGTAVDVTNPSQNAAYLRDYYSSYSWYSIVLSDDGNIVFNKAKTELISYSNASGDITIPDGVKKIGNRAFEDCSGLTSVTIPDSVTEIGNYAFSGCNGLKNIRISKNVTKIKDYTFSNCSNLTSIAIPDSVTSIGSSAFRECTRLTSVTFKDTNNWYYTSNSNYTDGTSVDVTNKAQNATYLKSTYENKYWYKYLETTVTVTADNVTDAISKLSIGGNHTVKVTGAITSDTISSIKTALQNNSNAKVNLDLSDTTGLTSIGDSAFYDCDSLTSVIIPDSVTSIGEHAFDGCSSLESVVIPDSVTSIGRSAFSGCSSLTSVTIPDSVTEIGRYAFYDCSSLTSVTIPDSVTEIGRYAFDDCSSLTSVTFKDTNNWYYTSNSNYTGGTAVNVTDKAQNATYLTGTYYYMYWYKK